MVQLRMLDLEGIIIVLIKNKQHLKNSDDAAFIILVKRAKDLSNILHCIHMALNSEDLHSFLQVIHQAL